MARQGLVRLVSQGGRRKRQGAGLNSLSCGWQAGSRPLSVIVPKRPEEGEHGSPSSVVLSQASLHPSRFGMNLS